MPALFSNRFFRLGRTGSSLWAHHAEPRDLTNLHHHCERKEAAGHVLVSAPFVWERLTIQRHFMKTRCSSPFPTGRTGCLFSSLFPAPGQRDATPGEGAKTPHHLCKHSEDFSHQQPSVLIDLSGTSKPKMVL